MFLILLVHSNSNKVCIKSKKTFWEKAPDATGASFPCTEENSNLPSKVVGFTADFAISADSSFTLFVDGNVVGASSGGKTDITRLTAALYSGSVIALAVLNPGGAASVKLRYTIDGAMHTIDDTWSVSGTNTAGYQMSGFDDSAWAKLADMTTAGAAFDKDVNWKGLESGGSEMFLRRIVPDLGATA